MAFVSIHSYAEELSPARFYGQTRCLSGMLPGGQQALTREMHSKYKLTCTVSISVTWFSFTESLSGSIK